MRKIILAAMGENRAIGLNNGLPWQGQQKADMLRFKHLTTGFPIIVGRKTYESFPKRPLPNRLNIVVTNQTGYDPNGGVVAWSIVEALTFAEMQMADRVFIVGGRNIYEQTLPLADQIEMTYINHVYSADTFFPIIDLRIWEMSAASYHKSDKNNMRPYSFLTYTRK